MKRLATQEKKFVGPSEEVISQTAFGIMWSDTGEHTVVSPHKWTILASNTNWYPLRDSRGEVHNIQWGEYHRAIEFPSWKEFEAKVTQEKLEQAEKELELLREEIQNLKDESSSMIQTIEQVYDLNANGGHGSRKSVSMLLMSYVHICERCNNASCTCHEDDH